MRSQSHAVCCVRLILCACTITTALLLWLHTHIPQRQHNENLWFNLGCVQATLPSILIMTAFIIIYVYEPDAVWAAFS